MPRGKRRNNRTLPGVARGALGGTLATPTTRAHGAQVSFVDGGGRVPEWTTRQRQALARMTRARTRREEIDETVADDLDRTDEEREQRLQNVVHAAWLQLRDRPDWEELSRREPPAADFPEIWARWMRQRWGQT